MARQIAYDPKAVRENLMQVFWDKGYAEASLTDLEAATQLNRRQLYNGVGDKRDMFLGAMDDFANLAGRRFLARLEHDDAGVSEIAALLFEFVRLAGDSDAPSGCMICSTSQEEIAADPAVSKRTNAYFDRIRIAYSSALTRAADRGEIALDEAAISLRASALLAAHVALCILGRAKRPVVELARIAQQAVDDIA